MSASAWLTLYAMSVVVGMGLTFGVLLMFSLYRLLDAVFDLITGKIPVRAIVSNLFARITALVSSTREDGR